MPVPVYTKQFMRDVSLAVRRGRDMNLFKHVATVLIDGGTLDPIYRNHALTGSFSGRRECRIESDWLLVYKPDEARIAFERMGSRSELFRR